MKTYLINLALFAFIVSLVSISSSSKIIGSCAPKAGAQSSGASNGPDPVQNPVSRNAIQKELGKLIRSGSNGETLFQSESKVISVVDNLAQNYQPDITYQEDYAYGHKGTSYRLISLDSCSMAIEMIETDEEYSRYRSRRTSKITFAMAEMDRASLAIRDPASHRYPVIFHARGSATIRSESKEVKTTYGKKDKLETNSVSMLSEFSIPLKKLGKASRLAAIFNQEVSSCRPPSSNNDAGKGWSNAR